MKLHITQQCNLNEIINYPIAQWRNFYWITNYNCNWNCNWKNVQIQIAVMLYHQAFSYYF